MKHHEEPKKTRGLRPTLADPLCLVVVLILGSALLLAPNPSTAVARGSTTDAQQTTPVPGTPALSRSPATSPTAKKGIFDGGSQPAAPTGDNFALIGGNFAIVAGVACDGVPDLTWNSIASEYFAVWSQYSGSVKDIYGQRIGASGTLLGAASPVAIAAGNQENPRVACNAMENEYMVAWADSRGSTSVDIYAQRVGTDGSPLGGNFPVASYGVWVDLAWNTTMNEYLVVWPTSDTDGFFVHGQRVGTDGVLLGGNVPVASSVNQRPAIAWNAVAGEYLLVFRNLSGGSNGEIYGQRISESGAVLGGDFPITSGVSTEEWPALAWNAAANEYLVVWQNRRNSSADIFGQRVSGSGALLGANLAVTTATDQQSSPSVAWNGATNEYLVVWSDGRSGTNSDIYSQRVTGSGELLGSELAVTTAVDNEGASAVAWNASENEYLVVWSLTQRTGPLTSGIYGQRIGYPLPPTPTPTATNSSTPTRTPTTTPTPTPRVELTKTVDRAHAEPGDLLAYTISLDNRKPVAASLHLTDTLPAQVSFVNGSLAAPATYSSTLRAVLWEGSLAPGATQQIGFQARVSEAAGNTLVVNRAWLNDGAGVRSALAMTQIGRATFYLPLLLRRHPAFPDAPVLNAITPPGAGPGYTVSWNPAYLADSYVLQQAADAAFTTPTEVYAGPGTSTVIASRGIATYHYRVKARNAWGDSAWSNVQSVEVRWELEPNWPYDLANGPLQSALDYYGYPADERDYFTFSMPASGSIVVELTGHPSENAEKKPQLHLYYGVPQQDEWIDRAYEPPYRVEVTDAPPGQYYILVFTPPESLSSSAPYTLRVSFP
jgi:uncharacterized repeat protein (TIGR01451 family)